MNKQRARQLYELADRLSKLDVNTLSEQQLAQRNKMIAKLQEEVKEGITDNQDAGEYDNEGEMAKQDLSTAADAANELRSILTSDENLPEWVQAKISKAVDYLDTVRDYMKSKEQSVEEADMSRRGFLGALAGAGLAAAGFGSAGSAQASTDLPAFGRKVQQKHFEMIEKNPRYAKEHADLNITIVRGMSGASAENNKQWTIKTAQLLQKYGVNVNEGVTEAGFPGAPDVEMPPMKPSGDLERDKLKQEYVDIHHEIKSLVDIPYRSDSSPEQKMQARARIKQLNDRADQIKAILEPRQPPNEWQKKTYGYDDNWNIVKKDVAEAKKPSPKLTPVTMKKTDPVSEEINKEAYERLQKVFAFKNYES